MYDIFCSVKHRIPVHTRSHCPLCSPKFFSRPHFGEREQQLCSTALGYTEPTSIVKEGKKQSSFVLLSHITFLYSANLACKKERWKEIVTSLTLSLSLSLSLGKVYFSPRKGNVTGCYI